MPLIDLGPSPFPPSRVVELKYCQIVPLYSHGSIPLAAGVQHEFALNSIFDPDITGVGHQPYGYDEFATLYHRYRVDRCQVQVDVIPNATYAMSITGLVQGPGGGLSLTNRPQDQLGENPKCKTVLTMPGSVVPPKIQFDVDVAAMCGLTKAQYTSDIVNYSGLVGVNPPQIAVFNLAASAFAGTTVACQAQITIIYHTRLWGPRTLGQS